MVTSKDHATQVTFAPSNKECRLSYIVDGRSHDLIPPPREMSGPISQVLKAMAELEVHNEKTPQHGRLRVKVGDSHAELAVEILPTPHGETIVLTVTSEDAAVEQAGKLLKPFMSGGARLGS